MNRKNGNAAIIIVLVIFIILSLSLGGYIIFDKLSSNDNSKTNIATNEVAKNDTTTPNSNVEKEIIKAPKVSVLNFYPDSTAILYDGSVYVNIYGSSTEIDKLYGEGTFQKLINTIKNNYKEYSFENFDFKNALNNNFTGMKLNTSNVEKIYSLAFGQGLATNYGIVLVNKDKTLSIISLYSMLNAKLDVTPIDGLSDIESIKTEDNLGATTYAVKTNGEKIDLSNYIPKDYSKF